MKRLLLACLLLVLNLAALACGDKVSPKAKSGSESGNRLIFFQEATPNEVWSDSRLREAFTKYWEAALNGRFEECYQKEAAYVRQLVAEGKYNKFMEFTTDPKKVMAFEVGIPRARSPYLYEVPLRMKMETPAPGFPLPVRSDYWVKTETGWYHAIKGSLMFPELGFAPATSGPSKPTTSGKGVGQEDS